jgi:hypothetical protein
MSRTEEDILSRVDVPIMPACIENGLRQAGLGESGGVHIADCDVVELSNDANRELVVKVTARLGDTGMKVRRLTSLTGALRDGEFVGQLPQKPRVLDPVDRAAKSLRPKSMPIPRRTGRGSGAAVSTTMFRNQCPRASHTALMVPACKERSLLLPAVKRFRSKPLGQRLFHFRA